MFSIIQEAPYKSKIQILEDADFGINSGVAVSTPSNKLIFRLWKNNIFIPPLSR